MFALLSSAPRLPGHAALQKLFSHTLRLLHNYFFAPALEFLQVRQFSNKINDPKVSLICNNDLSTDLIPR
jgi:hypothetical protein